MELISHHVSAEILPPIRSDVAIPGQKNIVGSDLPSTMFTAAPIRDSSGTIIAAITERHDPLENFSRIAQLGRIGRTGETYAFDRQGRLLTGSRFSDELISLGLIEPGEQSILSIGIRNPGGNLMQGRQNAKPHGDRPLTRMAASAIRGEAGYDLNGYRDYRGVPVMGVWNWNKRLGLGIASEINVDDAMESYYSARLAVIVILVISIAVSIGLTLLIMVFGNRASRALLQELRQLVANDDTKAADVLENLPPLFQGTEYSEDLIGIARAIEAYDFDTALNTLKELAEKLDIYP